MTFRCPLLFKVCWRREAFSLCGGVMAWMLPKWCLKWPSSSWPMNRYVCVYLGTAKVVFTANVFQIFCFYYTLLIFVLQILSVKLIMNSKSCHMNARVTVFLVCFFWHCSCTDILLPNMSSQYCDITYKCQASWHYLPLAFTHYSQNVNLPNS